MVARIAEDVDGTFINGYYELLADIDLSDITWTPIANFAGSFDGNGHTIFGMTATKSDGNIAFFASAGGTIKDIIFKNASIPNASWSGLHAILVAKASAPLTIENVQILDAKLGGHGMGFVIADANSQEITITNTIVSGVVMAYHANGQAAGFVALANNAKLTVENCTAIISTNAPIHNSNLAGFVATGGGTMQTFKNCIATNQTALSAHLLQILVPIMVLRYIFRIVWHTARSTR